MNYLLVDESDSSDFLECEGDVLKTFFASSKLFSKSESLDLIRKNRQIENAIKKYKKSYFNIVQFSAHGSYEPATKSKLDYTTIVKRRKNKSDIEIFRPDSIVRTGLQADIFLSTNCETFNSLFIDTLKHYKGIANFIAPVNSPYTGNTLIFSMMFYNLLLGKIRDTSKRISDDSIIKAFIQTKIAYRKYNSFEIYRLYNVRLNKTF